MKKRHVGLILIYAAMAAALACLALVIPTERTRVSYLALGASIALFVGTGAICAIRFHREPEDAQGWPGPYTVLVIQLFAFALLYVGAVHIHVGLAAAVEIIVYVLMACVLLGEDRLRALAGWVYHHKLIVLAVAAFIIAAIPLARLGVPYVRYRLAVGKLASGRYEEALDAFRALGPYRDAPEMADQCVFGLGRQFNEAGDSERAYAILSDVEDVEEVAAYIDSDAELSALRAQYAVYDVGNTVRMGSYQGVPLTWRVLDRDKGKRLLLAADAVTRKPYNDKLDIVSWETCTLRAWLNEDFLEEAFSEAERAGIAESALVNADSEDYRTDGGNDTTDRIFLLSRDDASLYRRTFADWFKCADSWWLRSPGCSRVDAVVVYPSGGLNLIGTNVDWERIAVRPAMWVDLSAMKLDGAD